MLEIYFRLTSVLRNYFTCYEADGWESFLSALSEVFREMFFRGLYYVVGGCVISCERRSVVMKFSDLQIFVFIGGHWRCSRSDASSNVSFFITIHIVFMRLLSASTVNSDF